MEVIGKKRERERERERAHGFQSMFPQALKMLWVAYMPMAAHAVLAAGNMMS